MHIYIYTYIPVLAVLILESLRTVLLSLSLVIDDFMCHLISSILSLSIGKIPITLFHLVFGFFFPFF